MNSTGSEGNVTVRWEGPFSFANFDEEVPDRLKRARGVYVVTVCREGKYYAHNPGKTCESFGKRFSEKTRGYRDDQYARWVVHDPVETLRSVRLMPPAGINKASQADRQKWGAVLHVFLGPLDASDDDTLTIENCIHRYFKNSVESFAGFYDKLLRCGQPSRPFKITSVFSGPPIEGMQNPF